MYFYNTAPNTKIPILSLYISSNCEIGNGFSPKPASIVYPGLLYSCINQSLKPAEADYGGISSNVYPLTFSNLLPIYSDSGGKKFAYFQYITSPCV